MSDDRYRHNDPGIAGAATRATAMIARTVWPAQMAVQLAQRAQPPITGSFAANLTQRYPTPDRVGALAFGIAERFVPIEGETSGPGQDLTLSSPRRIAAVARWSAPAWSPDNLSASAAGSEPLLDTLAASGWGATPVSSQPGPARPPIQTSSSAGVSSAVARTLAPAERRRPPASPDGATATPSIPDAPGPPVAPTAEIDPGPARLEESATPALPPAPTGIAHRSPAEPPAISQPAPTIADTGAQPDPGGDVAARPSPALPPPTLAHRSVEQSLAAAQPAYTELPPLRTSVMRSVVLHRADSPDPLARMGVKPAAARSAAPVQTASPPAARAPGSRPLVERSLSMPAAIPPALDIMSNQAISPAPSDIPAAAPGDEPGSGVARLAHIDQAPDPISTPTAGSEIVLPGHGLPTTERSAAEATLDPANEIPGNRSVQGSTTPPRVIARTPSSAIVAPSLRPPGDWSILTLRSSSGIAPLAQTEAGAPIAHPIAGEPARSVEASGLPQAPAVARASAAISPVRRRGEPAPIAPLGEREFPGPLAGARWAASSTISRRADVASVELWTPMGDSSTRGMLPWAGITQGRIEPSQVSRALVDSSQLVARIADAPLIQRGLNLEPGVTFIERQPALDEHSGSLNNVAARESLSDLELTAAQQPLPAGSEGELTMPTFNPRPLEPASAAGTMAAGTGGPLSQPAALDLVQQPMARAAATAAPAAAPGETGQAAAQTPGSAGGGAAPQGQNMEQMAQQIYDHLRRRLLIDIERRGSLF